MLCKQQQGSGEQPRAACSAAQRRNTGTGSTSPVSPSAPGRGNRKSNKLEQHIEHSGVFQRPRHLRCLRPVRTQRSEKWLPLASAAPQPPRTRKAQPCQPTAGTVPQRAPLSSKGLRAKLRRKAWLRETPARLSHAEGLVIHERQVSSNVQLKAECDICEGREKNPKPCPATQFQSSTNGGQWAPCHHPPCSPGQLQREGAFL